MQKNAVNIKHNKESMRELEKEANSLEGFIQDLETSEAKMSSSLSSDPQNELREEYLKIKGKLDFLGNDISFSQNSLKSRNDSPRVEFSHQDIGKNQHFFNDEELSERISCSQSYIHWT